MSDPLPQTLAQLRQAEARCTRCPLYKPATQVVPGEGPDHAPLMMVGEQPGNDEDLQGRPFVGPAGRMLDRAIAEAGIDRRAVFITNAVKHFKFEPRGKRRLHKRPNAYEVERCKWWNDIEIRLVRPKIVVALGATAARSLTGRTVTIGRVRGTFLPLGGGARLMVTIHPSALLRMQDEADKRREYAAFVRDLDRCADALKAA
jgi:uracil-DNA glycosylase family protein